MNADNQRETIHGLNNFLAVIMGYSDLLLMDSEENAMSHQHATKIQQAARKASELLNSLS
jgi:signal transduction histidine kinase